MLDVSPTSDLAESRWRALVDCGPFYVATFSPDGRLTFLNRAPGSRPPSDFIGRHISELLPLGDGQDLAHAFRRVTETGGSEQVRVPARLEEQKTVSLEVHLLPVHQGNRVTSVLALGLDVTVDTQVALELRMSVNALHRAIESREQLEADLHDGILQSLYGVGLRLEAARSAVVAAGGVTEFHLERAIDQIKATMSEVRRYIAEGTGATPGSVRWDEALTGLVRGLEVGSGPSIDLQLDRDAGGRVSATAQNEITFIAREAVSNAVRHAGASRITVRLVDDGPTVRLEVEDNGRGLPKERNSHGFGLLTMARRAAQIGAALTFHAGVGRGTLVRLELPVHDAARARD